MIGMRCFVPFVVLGVCQSESALLFNKYRKQIAAIKQNVSVSTMMSTVVGCDRYYSTMLTRVVAYDVTLQMCQLYEENEFPLMILPAPSPPRTVYVKGTVYAFVQTLMTWDQAKLNCEVNGGQLIKIESHEEFEHVASWLLLYGHHDFETAYGPWIGLSDKSSEGQFSWTDGSSLGDYSNWMPNNPDNYRGLEHCVHIVYPMLKWNDSRCDRKLWSFCEYN